MTRVYFVRHAQPEHDWEEDRTWSYVNILDTKSQTFLCCSSS